MRRDYFLALAGLLVFGAVTHPADIKIDRALKKEPTYATKPFYCLLLFGPNAATRVWLVMDGNTLYMDKNGNGDLTESSEKLTTQPFGNAVAFGLGSMKFGGMSYTDVQIRFEVQEKRNKREGRWDLEVEVDGRYRQYAFIDKLANKPEEAPVVHFGGPLQLGMSREDTLVRGQKAADLRVWITTHYPGVEFAPVLSKATAIAGESQFELGVPANIHPIAEIEFPAATPGAKPAHLRVVLKERC